MRPQYYYNDKHTYTCININIHVFFGASRNLKLKQKHVTCFLSGPLDTLKGWGCISIGQKKAHTVLYRPKPYDNIKELVHALTMRISSYGCTWEVWRGLKKQETSIIRNTHSKYGPVFDIKHKVSGNLSSVSEDLAI